MLFEYKIDNQIRRITNNDISRNIIPHIYKIKFYFNQTLWEDKEIFLNLSNKDDSINIKLGTWLSVISYIIPEKIITGDYIKMYAFSKDFELKTDVITIKFKDEHPIAKETPKCYNNIILGVMEQLESKFDNVILKDNYLQFYSNNKLIDAFFIGDLQSNNDITDVINSLQQQIDYLNAKNYGNIQISAELPEEGREGILYYIYNEDDDSILQYYYNNNEFHQLPGSKNLDLSDYIKKEDVSIDLSEQGKMIVNL